MRKLTLSIALLALCVLIAALYIPGLNGYFMFDDKGNIVGNHALEISSLDFVSLNAAFWSGDAGPLGRPVSMLTFALNYYFSGFETYAFKLTNLVIHLINTVLVFALAYIVFLGFLKQSSTPDTLVRHPKFPAHAALIAAALWGLSPLNLSSVLYVVQRMTSLSALFGFAALTLYGLWRVSPKRWTPFKLCGLASGVAFLLLLSALSKESGLLFIPLLLFMELVVFQGKRNGHPLMVGKMTYQRLVGWVMAAGVLVSLACLPLVIGSPEFPNRDFNLVERCMTEARVLFYYLRLFFFPSLPELALFHDDFIISTGLFEPATTALAFLGLFLITAAALRFYRVAPVVWFAWGWFLISHLMESTVFNLELIYEHRNYFATFGFVILIPWLIYLCRPRLQRYTLFFCAIFLAISAFVTGQRAILWENAYARADFESQRHPQSWHAHFFMAAQYTRAFLEWNDVKYARQAREEMRLSMLSYKPENSAALGFLRMNNILREPLDKEVLENLKQNLREGPAYNGDNVTLQEFATCQLDDGLCEPMPAETIAIFQAAIDNPNRSNYSKGALYAVLAGYYIPVFKETRKAEEFLHEAIALRDEANYRLLLAEIYIPTGRTDEANEQLAAAERLDKTKVWRQRIAALRAQMKAEAPHE